MHDLNENYVQGLKEKWAPVLDHEDQAPIKDAYRRNVTAILLENTEQAVRKENALGSQTMLSEVNVAPTAAASGALQYADPVMISMIRRTMPNLMAFDILGVQPMTGPTGLIFAMKSNYATQGGTEALHNEADTAFSGDNTTVAHAGTDPFAGSSISSGGIVESAAGFTTAGGGTTAEGETLGDGTANNMGSASPDGHFNQMAFSIDRTSVTAKTRALKAEYTTELSQDLKAVHGLDAESELSTILSTEINAEINREVLRTLYDQAKLGCVAQTTTQGVYDLATDTSGRWTVEKIKGLIYQLEREANVIAKETRRGKGNMIVCSADVASALAMAGVLDNNPQMSVNLSSDDTGQTFAGVMNGRMRVYIDPYFNSAGVHDFAMVGYKGTSAYDAGYFYCPYVPMQMVRAVGENTFQPKIGFKTRYGMVANPFAGAARTAAADGAFPSTGNLYYRLIRVDNINV
tara:strand:+ start:4385 stop:5770 length:1386 start_codon:yes stop_codon:yes gene_type:complete